MKHRIVQVQQLLYTPHLAQCYFSCFLKLKRRYLLGNGHYCRKWNGQFEFKSWTRPFVFHIVLISLGKVCIQVFSIRLYINSKADCSLTLVWQPIKKENSEFKTWEEWAPQGYSYSRHTTGVASLWSKKVTGAVSEWETENLSSQDKIPQEVWKTRNSDTAMQYITRTQ